MNRFDIILKKEPPVLTSNDVSINKIPVSNLEVNLKKLNFSHGDLLFIQFQEPQTKALAAEVFKMIGAINTFILRTPPVYAIVC